MEKKFIKTCTYLDLFASKYQQSVSMKKKTIGHRRQNDRNHDPKEHFDWDPIQIRTTNVCPHSVACNTCKSSVNK